MKKVKKLSFKFVFGFLLVAILICTTTCMIGYTKYKKTIQRMYNENAYVVARVAESYIDGDRISEYISEDQTDAAYDEMAAKINTLRSSSNARYIFIYVPNNDSLTYIFDAISANPDIPQMKLNETDKLSAVYKDIVNEIYKTGIKSDNYFISKSAYGYNTSAILPIKNSNGEVTALLNVDINMELIESTLREYIIYAVVVSSLLVIIFISIYLIYLGKSVIKPINIVAASAADFVNSNNEISSDISSIKTGDEIQLLAESITKMSFDIKNYIENLTAVTAEKERIGAELNVATQIQASMLPCIFPAFPDYKEFDIYATMQPAKEVGGDFYDFFLVDNDHLAVVIADVSGKGVPAALFMVIAKTLIKNQAQAGHTLADVFTSVNAQLCENNEAGMFVTGWMGCLEISTGKFSYVNAGHNPPLLKKHKGSFEYLKSRAGFVLAGMEEIRYKQFEITLEPGDQLYLYTDGVTEATDAMNELYGEERLKNVLDMNINASPDELLPAVKADIDRFVKEAPQFDDITMLTLKIKGGE